MGDITARKLEIIQAISLMQGEGEIAQLEATVQQIREQNERIRKHSTQKIPEKFDAEAVRRSRGYRTPNKAEFMRIVREMNVQEPIEDLLATLSK